MENRPVEYELSDHAVKRMLQRNIKADWIELTLATPDRDEQDRVEPTVRHAIKRIVEMDSRVLRVIYDPKRSPRFVISVYFDRRMKGKL